jgi:predicted nucleotidyltransferase
MQDAEVDPHKVISNFLNEKGVVYDEILFACVAGSTMYNLSLPNKSDHDFIAVYSAPTRSILSLTEAQPLPTIVNTNPDIMVYEVGKFCQLLQSGSPVILQVVFIDPEKYNLCYTTSRWQELRASQHHLITTQTVQAYIGYIKNELKQIQGKSKLEYQKCLYHAFRLIYETERILQGDLPLIRFETGSEIWKHLMEIRTHTPSQTQLNLYLREVKQRLEAIEKKDPWDEYVKVRTLKTPGLENFEAINRWLLSVRGM